MSAPRIAQDQNIRASRSMTLRLGDFAWEAIDEEAARAGSTPEEIVAFSVLYYLADVDSGRIARSQHPLLLEDPSHETAEHEWTTLKRRPMIDRG